jgi:hypothetical protein
MKTKTLHEAHEELGTKEVVEASLPRRLSLARKKRYAAPTKNLHLVFALHRLSLAQNYSPPPPAKKNLDLAGALVRMPSLPDTEESSPSDDDDFLMPMPTPKKQLSLPRKSRPPPAKKNLDLARALVRMPSLPDTEESSPSDSFWWDAFWWDEAQFRVVETKN